MTRITFDRFDFDPRTLELRADGAPVPLQQQPARVLALLLERRGQLVTREELRAAVWGDDTFVDFNRSLNFCINQIRAALGDDADEPRFVETLRGRGYRFKEAEPAAAPVQRGRRHWALVAVAAAIVLAPVAWGITALNRPLEWVAIAPFEAGGGSEDWAATLRGQVVAHLVYAGTRVIDPGIAQPGGSGSWYLRGRVDRSDEQYRVTATLYDKDGAVRFSDIFDGPPGDWIEAQNEMARIISQAVRYNVEGPGATGGIERRAPRRKIPFS
jgi:DNA-binding winged helix-turn-helix (wHTH) protein